MFWPAKHAEDAKEEGILGPRMTRMIAKEELNMEEAEDVLDGV